MCMYETLISSLTTMKLIIATLSVFLAIAHGIFPYDPPPFSVTPNEDYKLDDRDRYYPYPFWPRKDLVEFIAPGVTKRDFVEKTVETVVGNIRNSEQRRTIDIWIDYSKIADKFQNLTKSISEVPPDDMESKLKIFNNMTEEIVALCAINFSDEIELPADLPPKQISVIPEVTKKSAKEILLNFPNLIEQDYARMHPFIEQFQAALLENYRDFYMRHIRKARKSNREYLVSKLLKFTREMNNNATRSINDVSEETLSEFLKVKDSVETMAEEMGVTDDKVYEPLKIEELYFSAVDMLPAILRGQVYYEIDGGETDESLRRIFSLL